MPTSTTTTRRSASKSKQDPKKEPVQRRASSAMAIPAYVQRRLEVGPVSDPYEAEAERIADQVVQRKELDAGARYDEAKKRDASQARVQRKASDEEPMLRRAPSIARRADTAADEPMQGDLERRIDSKRGGGSPLPPRLQRELGERMGHDFQDVRVHGDEDAANLATSLHAEAFTVGNDVFFNRGRYAPESTTGQHLLAHELTHVVQQSGQGPSVQREVSPPDTGTTAETDAALKDLEKLRLPAVKRRHALLYLEWASGGRLRRPEGYPYERGDPAQRPKWRREVNVDRPKVQQKLAAKDPPIILRENNSIPFKYKGESTKKTASDGDDLLRLLQIPTWTRRGEAVRTGFEVDHMVELQVSGGDGSGPGNAVENMELLDQPSNSSSGYRVRRGIYTRARDYTRTLVPSVPLDDWLKRKTITFRGVELTDDGASESRSEWWTRSEIRDAVPLDFVDAVVPLAEHGTPLQLAVSSGVGGVVIGMLDHGENETEFAPRTDAAKTIIPGLIIKKVVLASGEASSSAEFEAEWDLPKRDTAGEWENPGAVKLTLQNAGEHLVSATNMPPLHTSLKGASPVVFDAISVGPNGLESEGRLDSTIPLINRVPLVVSMRDGDIVISYEYDVSDLTPPIPGLTIDEATLSIFYSGRDGLGVGGDIAFTAGDMGDGTLSASMTANGPAFEGSFSFDGSIFDRATIRMWYRDHALGAEGTLGIDRPDKIRGVKRGEVRASIEGENWALMGTVEPAFPGVQQASISAQQRDNVLTFEGDVQLAENAVIRSGNLHATLQKTEGVWSVLATGTAVPKVPGVESTLNVRYEDGTFDANVTASYQRAPLAGELTIGMTNAPMGEDGRPSGPAEEGAELRPYGGGNLTMRIAPWLEGTAGVQLLANGELELRGRLAVPQPLEVFPARRWDRSLLSVGFDIPIFGIAVAGQRVGIFCTVGGDLKLVAGIGPGQFREIAVDVLYNPSHPDEATVTGNGEFYLPADAGLRLGVHAAIGAGIPIVSAQAGIDIGGSLMLDANVRAPLQIQWTPSQGLAIDQTIRAELQPKFKFDVNGFLLVEADLLFTRAELYRKDWNLASFELGSDYAMALAMPFHYREGEEFNPSLDDLQITYPQVDPMNILRGLMEDIA